jgi:trk system potassium uptake protein TrkA
MNVLVVGAGEVGTHIAGVLSRQRHNVVVIDNDPEQLHRIEDTLDVQALNGHGTDLDVLTKAGAETADLVLCVSNTDEVNFGAALLAKQLGARQTIVRARKHFYLGDRLRHYVEAFRVDRVVCPEVLTAQEIAKRIEHPGTQRLEYFAHGRVQLRSIFVEADAPATGKVLREIPLPGRTLIASIKREGQLIIPRGDDRIIAGDLISIIGSTVDISRIDRLFRRGAARAQRIVIVGGGLVGFYLAQILERRSFSVTLIERRLWLCEKLSEQLGRTEVVHGDATQLPFLKENRFSQADAFVATTSSDDTNLMSCLLMRELGVPLTAIVMHRPDFASLVERVGVSYALSPRYVVADTVLAMLQARNVLSVAVLEGGDVEAVEMRVLPDAPVAGRTVKDAKLPRGSLLGGIVRRGEVIIPKGDDTIEVDDSVVVLAPHETIVRIEKLFRG